MGYAYDDRWKKMTIANFFKRRLIRLQPMVIMGMIIGALCFYFQDCNLWANIHAVPVWKIILVMLFSFTMLPLLPSSDIRGWNEMYPLNGPGWSLFYEYIANILYALVIRKFSQTALKMLVFLAACALIEFTLTNATGDVIGGWSLEADQIRVGVTRLIYPFFAGLLLSRIGKSFHVNRAFLWCSLLLVFVLSMPRIESSEHLWENGLYDALIIIFIFPFIVILGAGGEIKNNFTKKLCQFFGDISYPIYITHYPLIYIYTAWLANNKVKMQAGFLVAILVYACIIIIAYACLKFYDAPVRLWLSNRFIQRT